MGRGILGTITLYGTVVVAATVGFMGVDFLLNGQRALGIAFLALAVAMVAVEEYVTTPADVPAMIAERVVGKAVKTDDEE